MANSKELATKIKKDVFGMLNKAQASHIGGCLSSLDIVSVLYEEILRINPNKPKAANRDRFILSKGHAGAVVFATLANKGFFPKNWLDTFCENESKIPGHIDNHTVPGVELSTGSLGHGLSVGVGMAMSLKHRKIKANVFVLLSDGEMNTGSTWEAVMFASHHRLNNTIAIVDKNKIQSFGKTEDIVNLNPLGRKWKSFGWKVYEIDGHNHKKLKETFLKAKKSKTKPVVVICDTIKGKGLKDMEDKLISHYRSPTDEEVKQVMEEVR